MIRLSSVVVGLICLACTIGDRAQGGAGVTDSAAVGNYALTISDEDDLCILRYRGPSGAGALRVLANPPCYFLRRETAEPQSFAYQDVHVDAVVIIVGTAIDGATRQTWDLPAELVCGERMQGVLIGGNGIRMSERVLEGGVWCKDKGTDEKDFWTFSHG
jgi:hypothetical protein